MKPVLFDFLTYLPWSKNILERDVATHVDDAFRFDVRPKLEILALDILAMVNDGSKPELYAFYNNYVCQWWTLLAFKRFIQVYGKNITQAGYTKLTDPEGTFIQATSEERAIVMKQATSDASMCFTYMLQQTWTFDNITYRKYGGNDCGPRYGESFGINVLE